MVDASQTAVQDAFFYRDFGTTSAAIAHHHVRAGLVYIIGPAYWVDGNAGFTPDPPALTVKQKRLAERVGHRAFLRRLLECPPVNYVVIDRHLRACWKIERWRTRMRALA